jgi:hypothetical protein
MRLVSVLFILAVLTPAVIADEVIVMRETTGEKVKTYSITIHKNGTEGYAYSYGDFGGITTDSEYSTITWKYNAPWEGTNVIGERRGNTIFLTGTHKNNRIEKKFEINDQAWYQNLGIDLEYFVACRKKYEKFWCIRPDDMTIYEMEASAVGTKTVTANGVSYETLQVKVNLTGIASLFWQANYWFRISDFRYVRYESVQGGPGTPLTIVEFVSESKQ